MSITVELSLIRQKKTCYYLLISIVLCLNSCFLSHLRRFDVIGEYVMGVRPIYESVMLGQML